MRWLSDRETDIRCVGLCRWRDGERRAIDVEQVIPIPEANESQIEWRDSGKGGRKMPGERCDLRQESWGAFLVNGRKCQSHRVHIKPGPYHWPGGRSGIAGLGCNHLIVQASAVAGVYIEVGDVAEIVIAYGKCSSGRVLLPNVPAASSA